MKNIKQSNGLWINKDGKKVCYNPWTHFEVNNPNGDVTMCCVNPIVLGNVNEQYGTFDVLYNAQEDIYGFQFQVTGVNIAGGEGGAGGVGGAGGEGGDFIFIRQ